MLIKEIVPKFTELNELCSKSIGGKIEFATDDFFATAENLLSDSEPVFIEDKYTEFGKWMDGWETRRKRTVGHDWCIIKLATKSVIRGFLLDTAFFTGNHAPKYSIQAAILSNEEKFLAPPRVEEMGRGCDKRELEQVSRLQSEKWHEIVPLTTLRPGYEDTRRNYQKVLSDEPWTHLRLNIYPDGGIARLRVYGIPQPILQVPFGQECDLISMMNGTICQGFSNAHFGHPRNMIKPGRALTMADGWETARRLDRPNVIQISESGTLITSGKEWAVFKLAKIATVNQICVDTLHFKGNYPDSVKIEGAYLGDIEWSEVFDDKWFPIMPTEKLGAHKEHWFESQNDDLISHVRITIAPDGGISRLRIFGHFVE